MKNLSLFSLMLMVGMLLFLGGCQREVQNEEDMNFSEPFFQKKYALKYLPFQSVEIRSSNEAEINTLISKVHDIFTSNQLENRRLDIQNTYGYPLWTATEFIDFGGYIQTITPLIHPVSQNVTNFIHTDSRNQKISTVYYKMTEEVDFVFLQRYFIGKILGVTNGLSLRGTGEGGGTNPNPDSEGYWECVTVVNLESWYMTTMDGETINEGFEYHIEPGLNSLYTTNFEGGYINTGISFSSIEQDCEWISDNTPYNDIVMYGSASSGGGGSDYNNQTNSWYKCKNYLKENYNTEIAPEDEQYLKDLYDNCGGCAKAFFTSKKQLEKLKSANTSQKVKCAICKLNTNGFTGTTYFDVWDNISFPCENVDKDALLDELLPDCFSNTPVSWTQFMEAVGTKTWINKTLIASDESSGSSNLKNLELILGISKDKQKSLTDEDLCNAIQIAECLKPASIGQQSNGNEAEKAALLDFYKNSDLTNPCTGDAIDKDAIFLDLCESDNLNMSGLVEEILPQVCNQECFGIILDISEQCEGLIDRYVPCSEVIFTKKGDRAFAQLEIDNYTFSLCVPPPVDEEVDDAIMGGLLRSVNLKVEIQLPSDMVYTTFGYTNAQTRVAQFLSAAMQYAADIIPPLNSCDQLGTLRYQYRTAFLSFLNDNANKLAFFDRTSGIFFIQNFQEPGVTPEKAAPSLFSSVTDCD